MTRTDSRHTDTQTPHPVSRRHSPGKDVIMSTVHPPDQEAFVTLLSARCHHVSQESQTGESHARTPS